MMFDFSLRLQENAQLLELLSHYAQLGAVDQAAWQNRLMQMDGIDPKQLATFHGELIAFDWIEQNTGHASFLQDGALTACYRITQQGLREFRRIHGIGITEERPETTEQPRSKAPRKKKAKNEHDGIVASA